MFLFFAFIWWATCNVYGEKVCKHSVSKCSKKCPLLKLKTGIFHWFFRANFVPLDKAIFKAKMLQLTLLLLQLRVLQTIWKFSIINLLIMHWTLNWRRKLYQYYFCLKLSNKEYKMHAIFRKSQVKNENRAQGTTNKNTPHITCW